MTVITNTLLDPKVTGTPQVGVNVRAYLVPAVAFLADGTAEIITYASTTTATDGTWSIDLTPQSQISPSGSVYKVIEGTREWTIEVPDTGPVRLLDALTTQVPVDTGLTSALTQAQADARYVQLSAGVPDGSIRDMAIAADAAIQLGKLAVDPLARANHTGTQPSSTISDFAAAVDARVPAPRITGGMIPAGHGYKLWTFDPDSAAADFPLGSGSLICIRCYVPTTMTVTAVDLAVTGAGATPGSYSGVGLFDDAGTLLSKSVDAGISFTSTGVKTVPLSAPQALTADSYVWLSVLWQGASSPRIAAGPAVVADYVLNAGHRRAVFTTGQTTIPTTFDTATASTNNAIHWLAAG